MYKERCPSCEARFPLLGPKMKIADANKLRSKISFECPACGAHLERRLSSTEKLVKLAGAVALLCASVMSIYANMHTLPALAITKYLYLLAVVIFAIEIRNDLVKKRFYLASGN